MFITNREVHNMNTRPNLKFQVPNPNLTKFLKGIYYSGIKFFNHLPCSIKNLMTEL